MTTVIGKDIVIKNLKKVVARIDANADKGLNSALKVLENDAIVNLNNRVGTGYWGIPWGRSKDGTSIRNHDNWKINTIKSHNLQLSCISPHAVVVEIGGPSRIYMKNKPMPVGKQQGYDPPLFYAGSVRMQQGYHYLSTARDSPNTRRKMLNTMAQTLKVSIAGVSI